MVAPSVWVRKHNGELRWIVSVCLSVQGFLSIEQVSLCLQTVADEPSVPFCVLEAVVHSGMGLKD